MKTYEIPCLCGALVPSETRQATCPACKRVLIVEWGHEPVIVVGKKEPKP